MKVKVEEVVASSGEHPAKAVCLVSRRVAGVKSRFFASFLGLRLSDEAAKVITAPGVYECEFDLEEVAESREFDGRNFVGNSLKVTGIRSARKAA